MDPYYAGRTAVITGASSGIGRALAKALAARGCRVGLIARRREALEELVAEIQASGGTAASAPADVGERVQVYSAIEELSRTLGAVDLLVANAGVGVPTTLGPENVEAAEETFRVNVMGVIYAFEAVLPAMLEQKRGHLAAVSSLAAYRGMPGESAYCASKAAVNVYLEALRVQLRSHQIHVTTICPGFVKTPMTAPNKFAMPFVLEADEAAERIARALPRRPKVYNFPWATTRLVKLSRWAPDWLLARVFADYLEHPPMPEKVGASARVE